MKNYTRRAFLQKSTSTLATLGAWELLRPGVQFAMAAGTGKNVIMLDLSGGCDGLALLPYHTGTVADTINTVCRPNIHLAPSTIIDAPGQNGLPNKIGFHPKFARLINLLNQSTGGIRIYKRVGITGINPGRSHETSQNYYSKGATNQGAGQEYGWLARVMDVNDLDTFQVYGLGNFNERIDFKTREKRPLILSSIGNYNYVDRKINNVDCGNACKVSGDQISSASDDSAYARQIAEELRLADTRTSTLAQEFRATRGVVQNSVSWVQSNIISQTLVGEYRRVDPADPTKFLSGTGFANNCMDCAKIIKYLNTTGSGFENKAKLFMISRGGWDTHSNLRSVVDGNVDDVSSALSGLIQDLIAAGAWQNTVIYAYTEFGRTNYENALNPSSAGTDHGYANNHFVLGGAVSKGVVGDDPPTSELTDRSFNAISPTIDFRRPLHEILTWAGINPGLIFTEAYTSRNPLGTFG